MNKLLCCLLWARRRRSSVAVLVHPCFSEICHALAVGPCAVSGDSSKIRGGAPRFTNAGKIRNARLALVMNEVMLTSILEKAIYGAQHCCCRGRKSILLCRAWSLTREARQRTVVMEKGGCKCSKRQNHLLQVLLKPASGAGSVN